MSIVKIQSGIANRQLQLIKESTVNKAFSYVYLRGKIYLSLKTQSSFKESLGQEVLDRFSYKKAKTLGAKSKISEIILNTFNIEPYKKNVVETILKNHKRFDISHFQKLLQETNKNNVSLFDEIIKINNSQIEADDILALLKATDKNNFPLLKNFLKLNDLTPNHNHRWDLSLNKISGYLTCAKLLPPKKQPSTPEDILRFMDKVDYLKSLKTTTHKSLFKDLWGNTNYGGIGTIITSELECPEKFNLLKKMIEYGKDGILPEYALSRLSAKGKPSEGIIELCEKKAKNEPLIKKITSDKKTEVFNILKNGDTISIEGQMHIRVKDKLEKLNLSEKTFYELFDPIKTKAFSQGDLGNCYFIAGNFLSLLENPKGRKLLFNMIEETKDKIIITLPSYKNRPISYLKTDLKDYENNLGVQGALGLKLIEDTFARLTYFKNSNRYNLPKKSLSGNEYKNMMKSIQGGRTYLAFKNILNIQDCKEIYTKSIKTEDELSNVFKKYFKNENNIFCACTNTTSNKFSSGCDKDFSIYPGHEYCLKNFDPKNHTVNIINPHNSIETITISYEKFLENFTNFTVANLNNC